MATNNAREIYKTTEASQRQTSELYCFTNSDLNLKHLTTYGDWRIQGIWHARRLKVIAEAIRSEPEGAKSCLREVTQNLFLKYKLEESLELATWKHQLEHGSQGDQEMIFMQIRQHEQAIKRDIPLYPIAESAKKSYAIITEEYMTSYMAECTKIVKQRKRGED